MRYRGWWLFLGVALVAVAGCDADPVAPSGAADSAAPDALEDEPVAEPSDEPIDSDEPEPEPETEPEPEPVDPLIGLAFDVVVDGLVEPLDVVFLPGGGSDRLLVVERVGRIRLVEEGRVSDEPFLDLTGIVNSNSIEQGLLGLALHPSFPDDPRAFMVHSLPDNDNVIVSYRLGDDADRLDPDSREVLLTIDKEPDKVRHNGGQLAFGPDGHLLVSLGDAARASVNGQDPSTLPGSIVRLDVDGAAPYGIPEDNPFVDGTGGAPEVWWFGLRNPWRFSIDAPSGLAYIADVGQETVEEINVVPVEEGGLNFGWPTFEGTNAFYSDEPASPVTDPVIELRHDDIDKACSITGGHVYRGAAIPELDGHYFYADWCRGWIRSFRHDAGQVLDQQDWSDELDAEMVSAFGRDTDGELLVLDFAAGSLSRIVPVR